MITYENESDVLYVYLTPDGPAAKAARTVPLDDERVVDYDEAGQVIGVEFIGASAGIDLEGVPERARVAELIGKLRFPVAAA